LHSRKLWRADEAPGFVAQRHTHDDVIGCRQEVLEPLGSRAPLETLVFRDGPSTPGDGDAPQTEAAQDAPCLGADGAETDESNGVAAQNRGPEEIRIVERRAHP